MSEEEVEELKQRVGLVDGAADATTRRFSLLLNDDAIVQLDDLIAVSQTLPDGRLLTHYGIVVEGFGSIEGAQLATDTRRIAQTKTMPGEAVRSVEVQLLRTMPELWLPPLPGSEAFKAHGVHRSNALFLDQMEQKFTVGFDQQLEPVYADFAFMNGEKGGHVSISGISGVATKTSYALFLLYMLFETAEGQALLGHHGPETRAVIFNVKGEDLLHLDLPNGNLPKREDALRQWQSIGVEKPGPFTRVQIYVPRSPHSHPGVLDMDILSRKQSDVSLYGWTPSDFIRAGLLKFCFTDASDVRNQISFVEQRVRIQLARWAYPMANEPGAIVLAPPLEGTSFNITKVLQQKREPRNAPEENTASAWAIRDFSDLVDFLTERLSPESGHGDPSWSGSVADATSSAFLRRLYAQMPRIGHLVSTDVKPVQLKEQVTVVDIHSLHDDAQRFVVGSLLSEIFEAKQGRGREPLRIIVLDELNKYAPKEGTSPIKEILVDIAQRGRSLGVILVGAQQSAGEVEPTVVRNAAVKVVGRLDAGEAGEYRFLSPELRERASRFLPGTMVLDQPLIPAPIPIRFPFPAFATSVAEAKSAKTEERQTSVAKAFGLAGEPG